MIDTDKYEGHSEGEWEVIYPNELNNICVSTGEALYHPHCSTQEIEARVANIKLMADAPLLLAEVKRLRKQLAKANKYVHTICQHSDSMLMDYEDYMKGEEEE